VALLARRGFPLAQQRHGRNVAVSALTARRPLTMSLSRWREKIHPCGGVDL
jgi:hypothetical protein